MRVTHQTITTSTLANLQASLARVSALQEQMSTGRVLNRASDSPAGTVDAMGLRSELRQRDQNVRAADDAIGWLSTLDTALTDGVAIVRRVKELTLQGASTGSTGPQAREVLAVEVESLREELLSTANRQYQGRPVFGGTTGLALAFDAAGTYVGSPVSGSPSDPDAPNAVARVVGAGARVRVDEPGPTVFGDGASSLFALLDEVATSLRAGTAATSGVLDRLDTGLATVTTRLADVGARYARTESLRQSAKDATVTLTSSLAAVESIDLPQTIVELQMQQVAYQAALGATAKVIQPTLLDFLR